jgi:predicted oxidoreductase
MRKILLGSTGIEVPVVAIGCMRMGKLAPADVEKMVMTALEEDAVFFDHADIYGGGSSEEKFAQVIRQNHVPREKLILQSKCGIRKGMYDFSKEYILESVDHILERLQTDYLDILLLHRPDALMEPEEVAEAFDRLETSGKVRHFGVSNHNALQIRLLQKYVKQKLSIDQLQLSITNAGMITSGLNVNMQNAASIDHDGSILDFCRLSDITIQTWSPLQYGVFEGTFLNNDKFPELNRKLHEVAENYGVSETTIAIAWILRHPANMQVISGATNPDRIRDICKAADIRLTRQEWYEIYLAAGNRLP